ncbi:hypothetical protein [Paenibacillus endoradicis]|uniref:hypothetical protein n=1 Tax=Paenibacillus endoradicis TaxID=2972487 RepID=UPI0021593346|nr:hypothetical protein [Paenibacillus endoradicis]MCR8656668.1 hypothetical protein [Paenibacillus endoradicis]
MKSKSAVYIITIVILVIGITVGMLISKSSKDSEPVVSATPVVNESSTQTPTVKPTPTLTNENLLNKNYNSGDVVDISIANLSDSVVTVTDSLMDSDGHVYEIFNKQDETANSIVIHLNKQFTTLNYSVYSLAILGKSDLDGEIIISESTKEGEQIGNPILKTVIPVDEIYPENISVDVTGLDYVVIVDRVQNLQTYNFNAVAK